MTASALGKRSARSETVDEAALLGAFDELYLDGASVVAQSKVMDTIEQWLSRSASIDDERAMAMALLLAMDLEMFAPSLGGAIAFDRLARRRRLESAQADALAALKRACFTPMRIRSVDERVRFAAENLFTGATITVLDSGVRELAVGATVAARIAPLPSGAFKTLGPVTPLDEASLGIALEFARPGKKPNGQRCAAAVYKHVVRHGNPVLLGFNDFRGAEERADEEVYAGDVLDALAIAWHALEGAEPPAQMVDEVRAAASPMAVVETCFKVNAGSSSSKTHDFVAPYRWMLELQMETLQRRALAGSGAEANPFDTIAAIMDREIATNDFPPAAKALFMELRKGFDRRRPKQADDELTRVIERIRALRAKTLDQGCTEAEAVAAAAKVAELLDRYGLTLSEVDIRRQTCEGVGIDSSRKRRAPLDDCVDAIAYFCDCRAWQEVTAVGTLRSVFFGLPADVEAAHFLYGRVEAAFETETRSFRSGSFYAGLDGGKRRTATTSFQVGVGNGITAKLRGLKVERDDARGASGRDLVVVKHAAIDDEMAKLGLNFTSARKKGRLVDVEAFQQGQVAGRKFEARDSLS